jgi:fructokinase
MSDLPSILGIGEALFDVFPDGQEVVGGAPLNFAVHANRLAKVIGKSAAVASAVGSDGRGGRIRSFLQSAGLSIDLLQEDPAHPTGTVKVILDADRQASYEIAREVAWDHMEWTPGLEQAAARCELVCYGTLARRSPVSRETIENFLAQATRAVRLFDVNLRQADYDYSNLRRGCALATVVKLNAEELTVLAEMLTLRGTSQGDRIQALFERFPLKMVILTRGKDGTALYTLNGKFEGLPVEFQPESGADSVGAGDAATAAAAIALIAGLLPEQIVQIANRAGAYVAGRQGATPELPEEILRLIDRRASS